jgi:hypothetical protein
MMINFSVRSQDCDRILLSQGGVSNLSYFRGYGFDSKLSIVSRLPF